MKCVQLVFSPTGGTKKVSEAITGAWGGAVETVDLTNAALDFSGIEFRKEDLVLISVPSFGGRVPGLAAERIGMVHGNGACCVLVCVYGNRAYEDTLVELSDIAGKGGVRVLSAVAAVAEHSIMHQYAAGRPDSKDIQQLRDISGKILEKFRQAADTFPLVVLPGNRPYKKSGGAMMVPKAGKKCVGCGLCASECPAQAISRDSLKTADAKKCISCMRCVEKCPHGARSINQAMVSAAALVIKKACSVPKECELFL